MKHLRLKRHGANGAAAAPRTAASSGSTCSAALFCNLIEWRRKLIVLDNTAIDYINLGIQD